MFINLSEKDIADSIRYASYIQSALLPGNEEFQHLFRESFILYKPRDIVSGDFYWIKGYKNRYAVTAADCTGHGVPGAFLSIMGINFLNQIGSNSIPETNKILNQLREYVMKAMNQSGGENEQKDGIDMAMCVIDTDREHVEFSGAYNPIVYFNKSGLHIIRGDRMPIGISPVQEDPFKKHIIPFSQIDSFYIFSDGFADQFGGDDNKKLKFKNFKNLLRDANNMSFDMQKDYLEAKLQEWTRHYDQIDDILLIGIGLESLKK